MEVRIYEYLNSLIPRGITYQAKGSYTKRFYDAGDFDISIPAYEEYAFQLVPGRLINIDKHFWGVIQNTNITRGSGSVIRATGKCLKIWLDWRITVPDDIGDARAPAGYSSYAGSSEKVMKYYVKRNLAEPAYEYRVIPGLYVSEDMGRGLKDDAYYSRFESVLEVEKKLGERAKLGYDISFDGENFVFDVFEGMDRTADQKLIKPVIFSVERGTLSSFQKADETGHEKTAFYCTRAGAEFEDEAYTQTYYFEEQTAGLARKEKHLDISITTEGDQYAEFEELSRKNMEEYKPTQSFSCDITRESYSYLADYEVGDYVTIKDSLTGVTADRQIISVTTQTGDTAVSYSAEFGDTRITRMDIFRQSLGG